MRTWPQLERAEFFPTPVSNPAGGAATISGKGDICGSHLSLFWIIMVEWSSRLISSGLNVSLYADHSDPLYDAVRLSVLCVFSVVVDAPRACVGTHRRKRGAAVSVRVSQELPPMRPGLPR